MNAKYVIAAGLVLLVSCVISFVVLYLADKEHKKHEREMVDRARMDWARAYDASDALHVRQIETYKAVINAKDEVIAEKNKRIKQLEEEIALKNIVMACAKLDGSIDIEQLRQMIRENETISCSYCSNEVCDGCEENE